MASLGRWRMPRRRATVLALLGWVAQGCAEPAPKAEPPPTASAPRPPPPKKPPPPAAFTPAKVTAHAKVMGTHVTYAAFTSPGVDEAAIRMAFGRATKEMERVESLMTTWNDTSEIAKVNAKAGVEPVAVGPETYEVVLMAQKTSLMSEGTFDITFETLHGLWKFDEDLDPNPPTDAQIKAKLPFVGYQNVILDDAKRSVFIKKKETRISLGGIAKGYGVDKAVAVLDKAKIQSFFVQAGGDLFTRGKKPDGSAWSAGIRDPRGPNGSFFAVLPVSDHAFSTAGDYERSYIKGQKRYHHIIDPRTGKPATACRSVTIWADTALLADSIDDAVFILGPEKGLSIVEAIDDAGAVIVDKDNRVWVSERLKGKVQIVRPPTDGI